METKKDYYGSGMKLPWHFGNEDDFHPLVSWPIILGLKYKKLSEFGEFFYSGHFNKNYYNLN